jgi:hypothetical protein
MFNSCSYSGLREARDDDAGGITWNYTTWLNKGFLVLAAVLVIRFIRTGGIPMLRITGGPTRWPRTSSPPMARHGR